MVDRRQRFCAAIVFLSAVTGELLFLLSHLRGTGSLLTAISLLLAYLTDWSNLLVAGVCGWLTFDRRGRSSATWFLAAVTAITLVGIMFALMGGWSVVLRQGVSSTLAHVVTPVLMILLWLALRPHGDLTWRDGARVLAFPLLYLVAMFGRGLLGGGYPYPEVDVARVGWDAALAFAGVVFLLYAAIATIFVWSDRRLAT